MINKLSRTPLPLSTLTLFAVASWAPGLSAEGIYDDFGFVGGSLTYGESVFSHQGSAHFGAEPNLFYNGKYGFIDGALVNVSLLPWLGITGQWRFEQVSDGVDELPRGIDDRAGNGELGVTLGTVGARLTYLKDVTDEHDGYEVQLHLGRSFDSPIEDLTFTPYMEIDYRDHKLAGHLYNVSTSEAVASNLAVFESKESWVYQAGLIGIYSLNERWLGISKLEVEHHESRSPLVQRDLGWSLSVGLSYRFTD